MTFTLPQSGQRRGRPSGGVPTPKEVKDEAILRARDGHVAAVHHLDIVRRVEGAHRHDSKIHHLHCTAKVLHRVDEAQCVTAKEIDDALPCSKDMNQRIGGVTNTQMIAPEADSTDHRPEMAANGRHRLGLHRKKDASDHRRHQLTRNVTQAVRAQAPPAHRPGQATTTTRTRHDR